MAINIKLKLSKFVEYVSKNLDNTETSRSEAELITSFLTGFSRSHIYLNPEMKISATVIEKADNIIKKRNENFPLQYLLGDVEFYHIKLNVDPSVLIPRPETELLVDFILKENSQNDLKVLDLCTGSGAIAIALKEQRHSWKIDASDISNKALETARSNAELNNVEISFIKSDIFKNITEKFDIIVSNPPYVTAEEYDKLKPELFFEPKEALVADENGLFFYDRILDSAHNHLKSNGKIYLEIGAEQAEAIKNIALKSNYQNITVTKDYNNFDRFIKIIT